MCPVELKRMTQSVAGKLETHSGGWNTALKAARTHLLLARLPLSFSRASQVLGRGGGVALCEGLLFLDLDGSCPAGPKEVCRLGSPLALAVQGISVASMHVQHKLP